MKRNISSIQRSLEPGFGSLTDNTASRLSGVGDHSAINIPGPTSFTKTVRSDSRASNRTLAFDKSVNDMINKSFTVGHGPTRGKGISNVALTQGFKIK